MASVAATGSAMTSHDVQLDSSQWQAAQQDFASKLKAYRQSLGSVASDLQSQLRAREGRLAALQSCLEVEARVRDERNKIAQMVVSAARAGRLLHDEIESEYTAQLSLLDGEEAKSKRTLAQIAAEDETDKADTNAVSAAEARLTLDTMYADLVISAKTAARCLIRWADAKQRADAVFDEMTKIVHTRPASDRLITSADLQDIVTAQNASAAYDLADSAYLVACGSTGLRDYLVADQLVRACRAFTPSKSTDGERTARITVPSCAGYIQGWSTLRDDHQIVKAAHEQIFARPDVTSGHEALTDRQRVRADTIRYLQQGNQHETCFHAMAKAFGDMEAGRK